MNYLDALALVKRYGNYYDIEDTVEIVAKMQHARFDRELLSQEVRALEIVLTELDFTRLASTN
jgi:hypothetical protein